MARRKARRPAADKAARRPSAAVSRAGGQRGREAKPHKLELQALLLRDSEGKVSSPLGCALDAIAGWGRP